SIESHTRSLHDALPILIPEDVDAERVPPVAGVEPRRAALGGVELDGEGAGQVGIGAVHVEQRGHDLVGAIEIEPELGELDGQERSEEHTSELQSRENLV